MNGETMLAQLLAGIQPPDADAAARAQAVLDGLAKPPGSLGALEDIAARLAGITGQVHNTLAQRCVLVFAADNGVVAEGVASGPQSLTAAQTVNMLRGLTGVAVLARQYKAQLLVTDVGIAADVHVPGLRQKKLRRGTDSIARGPAMSRAEALEAIGVGAAAAREAVAGGAAALGVGEMGIGNTTTSSAVLCGLLGRSDDAVRETVGRGAGLTDAAYEKKCAVVAQALAANRPRMDDPVDILCKVGGLDLAAMTGAFLAGAACRVPVVIDGFISVVAALCAVRLCPDTAGFLFASHASHERGYRLALAQLGLRAYLDMDMRLGEGSGCPLMFSVMDGACTVINEMASFEQAEIDTAYLADISKEHSF